MTETATFFGRTAWAQRLETPLREFQRTETGGALVLLAAAVAALVWVNVDAGSYEDFWSKTLSLAAGDTGLALSLREWVNSGLMTLFFFVLGLEARRELDLGDLRDRKRFALPLLAGVGGMAAAVGIFLAFNAGRPSAHGWGVAMSTDTAFALGLLALVGPRFPARLRAFMVTVVVVDDLLALVVIATVYSGSIELAPLLVAVGLFGLVAVVRALGVRRGVVYALLGVADWIALHESGVEPVVLGLAMGLLVLAYPAPRAELERASEWFRRFREQPTPALERAASAQIRSAISPNERLQHLYHPWTSYGIVPLFALANAGIVLDGAFLRDAIASPITLGILCGYVVGKPVGILGTAGLLARAGLRPPVGWAAVAGGGTIAGIGFTVALLVATLAFEGGELEEAKLGILSSAAGATLVTWLVFRATARLPRRLKLRALIGTAEPLVDLAVEVDPERDHVRGRRDAPVTVVEYGDFECPYCGRAEPVVRELLRDFGDVRYVWRHLPLTDVHPRAQLAAEAAEAAAEQGLFWAMHDQLFRHQDELEPDDLVRHAAEIGADVDRFLAALREGTGAGRIAEDVEGADLSGVSGTPTFFVNGRRHHGAYDIEALAAAVRAAGARAELAS